VSIGRVMMKQRGRHPFSFSGGSGNQGVLKEDPGKKRTDWLNTKAFSSTSRAPLSTLIFGASKEGETSERAPPTAVAFPFQNTASRPDQASATLQWNTRNRSAARVEAPAEETPQETTPLPVQPVQIRQCPARPKPSLSLRPAHLGRGGSQGRRAPPGLIDDPMGKGDGQTLDERRHARRATILNRHGRRRLGLGTPPGGRFERRCIANRAETGRLVFR